LNARADKIRNQINEIESNNDLTPLGWQLLGNNDEYEKQNTRFAELESQLEEVKVRIEEVRSKMDERKLLFSGDVYIRQ
jgi:predicted  nucleic acid-binding Zn-ribbon protein